MFLDSLWSLAQTLYIRILLPLPLLLELFSVHMIVLIVLRNHGFVVVEASRFRCALPLDSPEFLGHTWNFRLCQKKKLHCSRDEAMLCKRANDVGDQQNLNTLDSSEVTQNI